MNKIGFISSSEPAGRSNQNYNLSVYRDFSQPIGFVANENRKKPRTYKDEFKCEEITSELEKEFHNKTELTDLLRDKFTYVGGTPASMEYAQANMDLLKMALEVLPILELSQYYSRFLSQGRDLFSIKEVEKISLDKFRNEGIAKYRTNILDKLVSYAWSQGRMDIETSDYLFERTKDKDNVTQEYYDDVINKYNLTINVFLANAIKVSRALSKAYSEDISRLEAGLRAKNLREFINICEGNQTSVLLSEFFSICESNQIPLLKKL